MKKTEERDNELIIEMLFCCIRDGIGLSYESWVVWQAVARDVIGSFLPERVDELDDINMCFKLYKDRLERFRSTTFDDILSDARITIDLFNSL